METAKQKTKSRIVLIEPFVLKDSSEQESWKHELKPRIQVIRKLAKEYQADYIELAEKIKAFGIKWGNDSVTEDGVHPTLAGHALLAKWWIEQVENDEFIEKN